MKISTLITSSFFLIASALLTGCETTHVRETQLDMRPRTAALEPQDVRAVVEKMVSTMLENKEFINEYCEGRPVLVVKTFKNSTSMHLNMKSITDSIRSQLIRSRKFRFMDDATSGEDVKMMTDQALNGMTDPSKAIAAGQQSAAQMYLFGDLSEMRNQTDGVTDRYYKFTLNVKDLRTGEIAWSDEKEIRKQETRNTMGF